LITAVDASAPINPRHVFNNNIVLDVIVRQGLLRLKICPIVRAPEIANGMLSALATLVGIFHGDTVLTATRGMSGART
jgi:hypothetical protein